MANIPEQTDRPTITERLSSRVRTILAIALVAAFVPLIPDPFASPASAALAYLAFEFGRLRK